jgi:pimeloyl-ACP methyl ester carboxylesterase
MATTISGVDPNSKGVYAGHDASSNRPFYLEMPERRCRALITSDHEAHSPEEIPGVTDIPEVDAHSMIGVSIGRAQTMLMSPQTPAAEKAAAMARFDGGGLFDGAGEEDEYMDAGSDYGKEKNGKLMTDDNQSSTPPMREQRACLPSPWRAEPKTFESQRPDHQVRQPLGPTSMLSDLNFKRYMSNFNLTSLPKGPSFKDFSVPSLSSILSNTRSRSPRWRSEPRPKRASTINDPAPSWGFGSPFQSRPTFKTHPQEDDKRGRPPPSMAQSVSDHQSQSSSSIALNRSDSTVAEQPGMNVDPSVTSQRSSQLRRATSDQSLFLRRVTSTGSSLGDDSRWENVQEQVNSRVKAIKDSLQDSSIRLPSMPNISSLNLNTFRPDFTRSRACSEAKQSEHTNGNRDVNANREDGKSGSPAALSKDVQKLSNTDAFEANGKTPRTSHSYFDDALENLTGDLVVMGGYRGSILRSAQPPHRQLWVPVKVGLNIRRVNLEVGLKSEDEENMHNQIFASGMLSHIGPVDMGRRLLKRLRTCKNAQDGKLRVHDYGYDWRLSPHLLSRRLLAYLQELPCNTSGVPAQEKGATVIAHSMGGLITRHVVNQRPELFAGVVYAGVPQHCVNILGPLRNGDEVLLSSKVLTAQVNFTMRSTFLLMPENGKCFVNKETKEEYPVNFFDVHQWEEYAWSPCIAPALPPANPQDSKSLFGSVTDLLPPMPSLPIFGQKASTSRPKDNSNTMSAAADIASAKINDILNPSATRALDPQFSPSNSNHTNQQSTIPLADAVAYLTRTLNATLAFKAEMIYDPTYTAENLYPPLSVLYANNTPTVYAARVSSRDAIKRADAYDDLQFASGDGVCLARAAMLPQGYKCAKGGRVRTERGHVGLLGDLEAVGKCLISVIEGRRQGTGLGVEKEGVKKEGAL